MDTRGYIIDMTELVAEDYLDGIPASASSDNCQTETTLGNCTGSSYTYYVDADGKVKTLLFSFAEVAQTGFQDVYP